MTFFCYIIRSANLNCTYNGFTNCLERRLRQHNGEISGGAKYTNCKNKRPWQYYAILTGFITKNEALSCEWKIKHPTGKKQKPKIYTGIIGRINSLNLILNLDCWTNKSTGLCSGIQYTLYLADDVFNIIDINNIKPNVTIKNINEIIK
jgi:predicted GIY-YIG superfamily endonuclease